MQIAEKRLIWNDSNAKWYQKMIDRGSLLSAFLANPRDRVIRGVLADWLKDNGKVEDSLLVRWGGRRRPGFGVVEPGMWAWFRYVQPDPTLPTVEIPESVQRATVPNILWLHLDATRGSALPEAKLYATEDDAIRALADAVRRTWAVYPESSRKFATTSGFDDTPGQRLFSRIPGRV